MQTGEKLHVNHDRFAVAAVVKNVIIVSHSLQKISAVSARFEDCGAPLENFSLLFLLII